ncbi:hypothetical protein [Streptococcus salivarius]|uniref:hypothetical protein n=1 Tax=Streptococcus salivarius TaxID=1304 RepID=UPI001897E01C|nr:hypothetical protein [Streptococcus salivarius]DAS60696.1 MAG TPA: hypothetical protein [Caudoviricetes sp.]
MMKVKFLMVNESGMEIKTRDKGFKSKLMHCIETNQPVSVVYDGKTYLLNPRNILAVEIDGVKQ